MSQKLFGSESEGDEDEAMKKERPVKKAPPRSVKKKRKWIGQVGV